MRNKSILLQKADSFVHSIYSSSKKFPKEEIFGLTSQIRRAALLIPLNIIEGFARQNKKEYKRFLEISYASLKETKYLLHFACVEKYLDSKDYQNLLYFAEELGKILWVSIQTLKK